MLTTLGNHVGCSALIRNSICAKFIGLGETEVGAAEKQPFLLDDSIGHVPMNSSGGFTKG